MIEGILKRHYQRYCVDPLVKRLSLRVTPTIITLLGGVIGVLAAVCVAINRPYWAILGLFISGYLDTLDGPLARYQNTSTPAGAVFDIMMDRLVEVAIVLGLFAIAPASRAWPIIVIMASFYLCISSFLVVGIFSENTSLKGFYYSPGLIERVEAFIFFGLMIIFPQHFFMISWLFSSLVVMTAIMRISEFIKAKALAKKAGNGGLYRPMC